MKDVDLFACNDTQRNIKVGNIIIKPKKNISIQVKSTVKKNYTGCADLVISVNKVKRKKFLNSDWVLEQVKLDKEVTQWLKRSLNWLPEDYVSKFL